MQQFIYISSYFTPVITKSKFHIKFTIVIIIFFVFSSCRHNKNDEINSYVDTYCSNCHLKPDPDLLTKDVWKDEVLPKMGARLGIITTFPEKRYSKVLASVGLSPAQNTIPYDVWSEIHDYYLQISPDSLESSFEEKSKELILFQKEKLHLPSSFTSTSLLHFDTSMNQMVLGDGINHKMYYANLQNSRIDSIQLNGAPSQFSHSRSLSMGNMPPHDNPSGSLYKEDSIIISNLRRPVHFVSTDIDDDGDVDELVSSFGNLIGDFSIFRNHGSFYEKEILIPEPGAIKSVLIDLDNDELKDILVLMAQGREGFFWFKNMGNGSFSEKKTIIEFQPSFGSSYFELYDFNKDGKLDLLYCNGDNGDYRPLHKPYHGIRLLLNESDGQRVAFKQSAFFPYNGVYKAVPRDYDLDGDIDIAAISYFPNYPQSSSSGFRFYENKGSGEYEILSFSNPDDGKWLLMEVADIDGDDDEDILLGHSNMMTADVPRSLIERWSENPVMVQILRNVTKK